MSTQASVASVIYHQPVKPVPSTSPVEQAAAAWKAVAAADKVADAAHPAKTARFSGRPAADQANPSVGQVSQTR